MKKYYNIDFFRFAFAVIIVYYHILHPNIISSVGEMYLEPYNKLREYCNDASLLVEGFLVISGFFLYKSIKKHIDKDFIELLLDKIVRLWPVFFVYTAISVVVYKTPLETALLDLFFLRATGLSMSNTGIIWYIGPFFWSTILIMAILTVCEKSGLLIISVLSYFGYAINLNTYNGGLGRDIRYGFVSTAMCRVFAGLAVGCLLAAGMRVYEKRFGKNVTGKNEKLAGVRIFTVLETTVIYFLAKALLWDKTTISNGITAVILFAILVFCMVSGHGLWAKVLNRKIFGVLGRYSYSIYVMQQIAFYILRKTFWRNTAFLNEHIAAALIISTLLTVLVGVVTYHIVEVPAVKMYNKWKSLKKGTSNIIT